jgi:alkaline phosphatase D
VEVFEVLIEGVFPQIKAFDLSERGYLILDVTPEKAQGDWFFVDHLEPSTEQRDGFHLFTEAGNTHLQFASGPAPGKINPPPLAPGNPEVTSVGDELAHRMRAVRIHALYPNPTRRVSFVQYSVGSAAGVHASVVDVTGQRVLDYEPVFRSEGTHGLVLDASRLSPGVYMLRLEVNRSLASRILIVQ